MNQFLTRMLSECLTFLQTKYHSILQWKKGLPSGFPSTPSTEEVSDRTWKAFKSYCKYSASIFKTKMLKALQTNICALFEKRRRERSTINKNLDLKKSTHLATTNKRVWVPTKGRMKWLFCSREIKNVFSKRFTQCIRLSLLFYPLESCRWPLF